MWEDFAYDTYAMKGVKDAIKIYSKTQRKLFDKDQRRLIKNIEETYVELRALCVDHVDLPQTGTHKEWIKSRVLLQTNFAIVRLLHLTESFAKSARDFNGAACSTLAKGMAEIVLNMGYICWIVSSDHDFKKIQKELDKLMWGNRDQETGLTSSGKVSHRDMYERADEEMAKLSGKKEVVDTFEKLYKGSNAVGHHNYEATMFCGLQNEDVWNAKDRKESFFFLVEKIFQLFLYASTTLVMTKIFLTAINHYVESMPDFLNPKK